MRNATIATSRTRADSPAPIIYRPLDPSLGDVEQLRAVRATRAASADPSTATVDLDRIPVTSSTHGAARHRRTPRGGLLRRWFRAVGLRAA